MNSSSDCYRLHTNQSYSAHNIAYITVCSMVVLFLVIANLFTAVGLWKTSDQFTVIQKLMFFQNLVDLSIGFLVAPYQILLLVLSIKTPCVLLVFNSAIIGFNGVLTITTLTIISVIRYFAVTRIKPLHFVAVAILINIAFIFSAGMSVWYGWITLKNDKILLGWFYIFASAMVIFLFIVLFICNVRLLLNVKRRTRRISQIKKGNTYQDDLSKTIRLMCITLILCYLPAVIVFGVSGYLFIATDFKVATLNIYITWSYLIVMLNSGFNSVIYSSRTTALRNFYKQLYAQCCEKYTPGNKIRSSTIEDIVAKEVVEFGGVVTASRRASEYN